jgi:hypothetical protein
MSEVEKTSFDPTAEQKYLADQSETATKFAMFMANLRIEESLSDSISEGTKKQGDRLDKAAR